ncbi:hypothetical protein VPH35_093752 [Triticum aestivum]
MNEGRVLRSSVTQDHDHVDHAHQSSKEANIRTGLTMNHEAGDPCQLDALAFILYNRCLIFASFCCHSVNLMYGVLSWCLEQTDVYVCDN